MKKGTKKGPAPERTGPNTFCLLKWLGEQESDLRALDSESSYGANTISPKDDEKVLCLNTRQRYLGLRYESPFYT